MTSTTSTTLDSHDRQVLRLLLGKIHLNVVTARDHGISTEDLDARMARLADLGLDFERDQVKFLSGFGGQLAGHSYTLHPDSRARASEIYEEASGAPFLSRPAVKLLTEALNGFAVNERISFFKLMLPAGSVPMVISELQTVGVYFNREDSRPGMGLERMEMPRWTLQAGSRELAERLLEANQEPGG